MYSCTRYGPHFHGSGRSAVRPEAGSGTADTRAARGQRSTSIEHRGRLEPMTRSAGSTSHCSVGPAPSSRRSAPMPRQYLQTLEHQFTAAGDIKPKSLSVKFVGHERAAGNRFSQRFDPSPSESASCGGAGVQGTVAARGAAQRKLALRPPPSEPNRRRARGWRSGSALARRRSAAWIELERPSGLASDRHPARTVSPRRARPG